jgi:dual 3',5'-cyclic-AMP and -GMP phosphodiesterase 11
MMFTILKASGLSEQLNRFELLALMIGCFCHDLDHRGTNNSFEIKNSSPLAHLYSTSTMEHHHFDQCLMLLNSPGNQILGALSPLEYGRVVALVEEAILATDLAVYMKQRSKFIEQHSSLRFSLQSRNRRTLRAMLMTICDLNAVSKPWKVQKHIAKQVAEEFFRQGDFERKLFNRQPADMFNREKRLDLPRMQVEFIGDICQPLFQHFRVLFGSCFVYRDLLLVNKMNWVREAAQEPTLREWARVKMHEFRRELIDLQVSVDEVRDEAVRQMPVVLQQEGHELLELMRTDVQMNDT